MIAPMPIDPADGALGEPEHEEAHEIEDEQQVGRAEPAEELPEVQPSLLGTYRFARTVRSGAAQG